MISTMKFLVIGIACLAPILTEGKVVFYEDFTKGLTVNTTSSSYVYYSRKTYTANDGKFIVNNNKTVTQDIRPFKLTVSYGSSGTTDRFKSIVLQKNVWNVSKTQVLTCELKTWSKQWGVASQKFGKAVTDPYGDVRLSTCGLYVGDPKSYIVAHFLQSDKENVPYHGRQSSGQNKTGELGFYHAYNTLKTGVSKRTSPYNYTTLTVQFDRGAGTLRWLADGKVVNTVSTIGIPTAGMRNVLDTDGTTTKVVDPAGFQCGFGCWDFLDFADPLNTKSTQGLVRLSNKTGFYKFPTSFVDPTSKTSSRLFGQGSLANHAYFKIDVSSKTRLLREGKMVK